MIAKKSLTGSLRRDYLLQDLGGEVRRQQLSDSSQDFTSCLRGRARNSEHWVLPPDEQTASLRRALNRAALRDVLRYPHVATSLAFSGYDDEYDFLVESPRSDRHLCLETNVTLGSTSSAGEPVIN